MSEQIVNVGIDSQFHVLDVPLRCYAQVVGVPWLDVVGRNVLLLVVAFTNVDEAIVEAVAFPLQHCCDATAVMRDIGYLVLIVVVVAVSNIACILIGVLRGDHPSPSLSNAPVCGGFCVHAVYFYKSEVEHSPAELLPLWIGYDFVGDLIIVIVGIDAQR